MFAYVVKRLLLGVVILILVSMSIFLLFWFGPSEPARPLCNQQTGDRCTPERYERFEEALGYNNPWYTEYVKYMKGIVVGRDIDVDSSVKECPAPCFGLTYSTSSSVWEEMKVRLPASFSVAIGGAFLYLAMGIPLGVAAARRRGTLADKGLVSSFLVISSVPYYLFALIVWLYVTVIFQIPFLSDTGYFPFWENPAKWFSGMLLAWICLGIFGCTQYTRYTRGAMVETLGEDYIRTAKAKGLTARKVVYRHGLRSAMVPVVTIFGIDFGVLLAGTVITEKIFNIDGIGYWSLVAVRTKDLPIVSATALFAATCLIISNIIVDVIYSVLDPRVRLT